MATRKTIEPDEHAPARQITGRILLLRGCRVIVDTDLAVLYGIRTKRLNEQIKRNQERFPPDFMFELTEEEKARVVASCDHLARLKFSPGLPSAFTEHGVIMAATVLNTVSAVEMSIEVVRAFVLLRQMLQENAELAKRLAAQQKRAPAQVGVVFESIRELMTPPAKSKKRIGFGRGDALG